MEWLEAALDLAKHSPDKEIRERAATVVLAPPIFYTEGLVDPAELESILHGGAVPVIGPPDEVVSIGWKKREAA